MAKRKSKSKYAYRYHLVNHARDASAPLAACPGCHADLTADDSIEIEFTNGRRNWKTETALETDGTLYDPTGCVRGGLHSGTFCNACGELLINLEGVWEEQLEV